MLLRLRCSRRLQFLPRRWSQAGCPRAARLLWNRCRRCGLNKGGSRGEDTMQRFVYDVRYALRQLRKSPGFALTTILTLAFGIAATTAIFSIVEGVLLRPLPFVEPSRLMALGDVIEGTGSEG